ncbi:hypothetical protein ABFX02_04G220200 [Erythranthe guttata]
MFRYVDVVNVNPALVNDVLVPAPAPAPAEPLLAVAEPIQESHVSERSTPSAEEAISGEVINPPENGDVPIAEEEVPVAEVVDEVQDDREIIVESSAKIEELPKKSYAFIVKHLKESGVILSPPVTALRKAPPKKIEQVKHNLAPPTDGPVSSLESVDNGNSQEEEADGYSVYIKGLPMNATDSILEEVFKKFGAIKSDGIQVRSNRQQGFCFGFVEFEEASSLQKALEASPVTVGGRQVFVEEKRSTNSRGNNRGRFQPGRGSGFRNEGVRGRGNYGGGRGGYNRGELNGRSEYGNNRGGNRGGYQRSESVNGGAKNMTPRVSATA